MSAQSYENIAFIASITAPLLAIECRLRERVQQLRAAEYAAACEEFGAPTLGALLRIITEAKLENEILRRYRFRFADYHPLNDDQFRLASGRICDIMPSRQAKIALNLLRCVRNRAFHCGDMFEMVHNRRGELVPRIFTQERFSERLTLSFTVLPERIERLLADIAAATGVSDFKKYTYIHLYISDARE